MLGRQYIHICPHPCIVHIKHVIDSMAPKVKFRDPKMTFSEFGDLIVRLISSDSVVRPSRALIPRPDRGRPTVHG